MFEKEAEEYADERCGTIETEEKKFCRIDWQKGAEFGYKLAHEEMDYLNKHWGNGKDTANEWHYVKDKDYPKDNKPVLCILGDIDSDNCEVGYYNDVGSGEPWHFETYHLPDDDGDNAWGVSAWKEIVLPELKGE